MRTTMHRIVQAVIPGFGVRKQVSAPQDMKVVTDVPMENTFLLRFANLFIPLALLAYGIMALLIKLGLISSLFISTSSLPFSMVALGISVVIGLIAWLGPKVAHWYRARHNLRVRNQYPLDENDVYEIKRNLWRPSPIRSLDLTLRATLGVGFGIVAVLIALAILNPAGAISGASLLLLIKINPIPLALAAGVGITSGVFIAVKWRSFALWYFEKTAKRNPNNPAEISRDEFVLKDDHPQRGLFRGSYHDTPLPAKVFGGALAGIAFATFVGFIAPTGIGAGAFVGIGLGTIALAIVYPYIFAGWDWVLAKLGRPRKFEYEGLTADEIAAKKTAAQQRSLFEQSNLDMDFWFRIFLGVSAGLALGGAIGGSALIIVPSVLGGLAFVSPFVFGLLKHVGFIDYLKRKFPNANEIPHGHKTPDISWYLRLFNAAAAGGILYGALLGVGTASGVALGIAIGIAGLATFSNSIFAFLRSNNLLNKLLLTPEPEVAPGELSSLRKFWGYAQWYVRIALGGIVGITFSTLVLGSVSNPLVGPAVIISSIVGFWAIPFLYERAPIWARQIREYFFGPMFRRLPSEEETRAEANHSPLSPANTGTVPVVGKSTAVVSPLGPQGPGLFDNNSVVLELGDDTTNKPDNTASTAHADSGQHSEYVVGSSTVPGIL